jgi:hypothetical protein
MLALGGVDPKFLALIPDRNLNSPARFTAGNPTENRNCMITSGLRTGIKRIRAIPIEPLTESSQALSRAYLKL